MTLLEEGNAINPDRENKESERIRRGKTREKKQQGGDGKGEDEPGPKYSLPL
jgi:hypothetical protein